MHTSAIFSKEKYGLTRLCIPFMFSKAGNFSKNGSLFLLLSQYKAPIEIVIILGPIISSKLVSLKQPGVLTTDSNEFQNGGRDLVVAPVSFNTIVSEIINPC